MTQIRRRFAFQPEATPEEITGTEHIANLVHSAFGGMEPFKAWLNTLNGESFDVITFQMAIIAAKMTARIVPKASAEAAATFLGRQLLETREVMASVGDPAKITAETIRSVTLARAQKVASDAGYFQDRAVYQAVLGNGDSLQLCSLGEELAATLENGGPKLAHSSHHETMPFGMAHALRETKTKTKH